MISVKHLAQNQLKSNNINHAIHLNYFRKKNYECWALTKTQFILAWINSQILLFWNYEKFILIYLKSRETKNYLKIEEKLYKCIPKWEW